MSQCTNSSQWSQTPSQTLDPDLIKTLLGLLTILAAWLAPPPHPMLMTKSRAAAIIVKDPLSTDNKNQ